MYSVSPEVFLGVLRHSQGLSISFLFPTSRSRAILVTTHSINWRDSESKEPIFFDKWRQTYNSSNLFFYVYFVDLVLSMSYSLKKIGERELRGNSELLRQTLDLFCRPLDRWSTVKSWPFWLIYYISYRIFINGSDDRGHLSI